MIENKMLENRIIFINGEINDDTSYDVITKLLYLDSINNDDISLYINSPGGSVISGLSIIDCMKIIKSNVKTFCIGEAYSMASIILSCGTKGKRYALENSEIMIHQPIGGVRGKADDVIISTKRLEKTKEQLVNILIKNTNQTKKKIIKNLSYDNFMSSKEAKTFGLIDNIIKSN